MDFDDWDTRSGKDLQRLVDAVCTDELANLTFSVTIADPNIEDCPLIACSKGFTDLTGYALHEIVGRNCRFLVNNVPPHLICEDNRRKAREFAAGVAEAGSASPCSPSSGKGEVLCVQTNARKTGELFKCMFYMKQVRLNGQTFIISLQTELPEGWQTSIGQLLEDHSQAVFQHLSHCIWTLEMVLSRQFWYSTSMQRQRSAWKVLPGLLGHCVQAHSVFTSQQAGQSAVKELLSDGVPSFSRSTTPMPEDFDFCKQTTEDSQASTSYTAESGSNLDWSAPKQAAPKDLYKAFLPEWVQPWQSSRFEHVRRIQDAPRNSGAVNLMRDNCSGQLVAVKEMPNEWIESSHEAFVVAHPEETEQPWQDVGCVTFLDNIWYPFTPELHGVFRSIDTTYVVTEYVEGGDLFTWASNLDVPPGPEREEFVKPIAKQLMRAVQQLHELSIVHNDISAENVVLSDDGSAPDVKLIDFGAATTSRMTTAGLPARGKPSYQAPEVHQGGSCDAFLLDAFAVGVLIYALCMQDYPWMDTEGRGDKRVQYVRSKGFRGFLARSRLANSTVKVAEVMSEDLISLLEGLLSFDPEQRFTLGESAFSSRTSVWSSQWLQ
mmetsp:Transcript_51018/g.119326  ORF Transcript_51018/g.119326 Transcript_51018/m.119326 type:complete len:604 (+) Transcript_51018:65-1876(+)